MTGATTSGDLDGPASGFPESSRFSTALERMSDGFYAVDRDWRLLYVNAAAESFWGRPRHTLLGRSLLDLFPKFPGSPPWDAHRRAMESGRAERVETTSTAIGRPVELRLFPSEAGLSVYFRDLSDRREMEQELRTRNELLTLAEVSAGVGVWVADLVAGTVQGTPQFFQLLGLEPVAGPVSQDLPRSVRHPDDRERVREGFRQALASGADTYESEYRIIRPSGEQRWIFGRGSVVRDQNGKPWRYAGVDIDVTDRKERDEHLRLVTRELLHRTNNLLTVVQGMARQTGRDSQDISSFLHTLNARLEGLAESNRLLALGEWRGASLETLIRAQIGRFADETRFDLEGPKVGLSPKATQSLGLAFHELCTNATKYGALANAEGQVRVRWEVEDTGLHLEWQETGGPAVTPPSRSGFGRVVSEQMIATSLNATVRTVFEPGGLRWTVELPNAEYTAV
jgi:PAS domain S-box-containing protein